MLVSVHHLGEILIQSGGQSVSAPRGKASVRLSAHTELRAKRQRSARESGRQVECPYTVAGKASALRAGKQASGLMPVQSCGQSVSARRGKRHTEIGLFTQDLPARRPAMKIASNDPEPDRSSPPLGVKVTLGLLVTCRDHHVGPCWMMRATSRLKERGWVSDMWDDVAIIAVQYAQGPRVYIGVHEVASNRSSVLQEQGYVSMCMTWRALARFEPGHNEPCPTTAAGSGAAARPAASASACPPSPQPRTLSHQPQGRAKQILARHVIHRLLDQL